MRFVSKPNLMTKFHNNRALYVTKNWLTGFGRSWTTTVKYYRGQSWYAGGQMTESPIINGRLVSKATNFRNRDEIAQCFRKKCLFGKAANFFIVGDSEWPDIHENLNDRFVADISRKVKWRRDEVEVRAWRAERESEIIIFSAVLLFFVTQLYKRNLNKNFWLFFCLKKEDQASETLCSV